MEHQRLRVLATGDVAIVAEIRAEQMASKRLADMGFVRGVRLEMVRPGSPCVVRINGTRVGLGAAYQDCIRLFRSVTASEARNEIRGTQSPPDHNATGPSRP